MKARKIVKWGGSGDEGCPAMYAAENPDLSIAQGTVLDDHTASYLEDVADDETAVLIPTETVLRFVDQLLRERGQTLEQALAARLVQAARE